MSSFTSANPVQTGSFNINDLGKTVTGMDLSNLNNPLSKQNLPCGATAPNSCAQVTSCGATVSPCSQPAPAQPKKEECVKPKTINPILTYILLSFLAGILIALYQPSWVVTRNKTTNVNELKWGAVIIYALLFGLLFMLIYWLLTVLFVR